MSRYRTIFADPTRPFSATWAEECTFENSIDYYSWCCNKVVDSKGHNEVVACYKWRFYNRKGRWMPIRTYTLEWYRRLKQCFDSQLKLF